MPVPGVGKIPIRFPKKLTTIVTESGFRKEPEGKAKHEAATAAVAVAMAWLIEKYPTRCNQPAFDGILFPEQ